ncbi:PE-PPE domain-containing protein [Mycolicibacterium sp. P1-5]|uniref:PE-PPE domain-containing protein n=1 Tax=Mycolicibacterium sp. P1-5 TaxID=2024617 RepID=UPI001D14F15A|nr:PE-PPE domain-containing protein [Mycolicibacterium sp. P1-5]
MALITPANSTAQIFASSDYYNRDWSGYGPPQVVPFFLGPQGIADAIDANSADPRGVVVLASGWGAGQTGTALGDMQSKGDPALNNVRLVVLDNNTNRAGGGFWTTYWMFAPLLATSAAPTPNDLSVPVVDTAYEYNINSDAPTYPINVLSDANSLMAYAYDYGAQATAPMPQEALTPVPAGDQHYHYIVDPQGNVVDKIPVDGNITYVTFQSDGLPLVRPLRMVPGGNIVADAVEPAATVLVNAGYQDNKPIPDDPGVQRPVGVLPPASNSETVANQLPVAVQQGTNKAQSDLPSQVPALPNLRTGATAPPTAITASSVAPAKKVTGTLSSTAKGIADGLKSLAPHRSSTSSNKS